MKIKSLLAAMGIVGMLTGMGTNNACVAEQSYEAIPASPDKAEQNIHDDAGYDKIPYSEMNEMVLREFDLNTGYFYEDKSELPAETIETPVTEDLDDAESTQQPVNVENPSIDVKSPTVKDKAKLKDDLSTVKNNENNKDEYGIMPLYAVPETDAQPVAPAGVIQTPVIIEKPSVSSPNDGPVINLPKPSNKHKAVPMYALPQEARKPIVKIDEQNNFQMLKYAPPIFTEQVKSDEEIVIPQLPDTPMPKYAVPAPLDEE